jgi:hypothetical protein
MLIRSYSIEDEKEARRIFDKFYRMGAVGQLTFPNISNNYLCAFTVIDNDNKIITVGGVRTIAEVTLMTDKSHPVRVRINALKEVLNASKFIAKEFNFDWLHAVTDDPTWANQMKHHGFLARGEALEIHVEDVK